MSGFLGAPANPLAPAPDLGAVLTKYYVRPAGDNANDGLTPATAWATLAYAKTHIPAFYNNGGFVIDVTSVNETLTAAIGIPIAGPFFGSSPGSLLGFNGAFTIHSDLVDFLTIAVVDIVSVTTHATTGQKTINTTGGLVPGQLVGKKVTQSGVLRGVVKRNTASAITTSAATLDALSPITLSDPGATLWELSLTGGGIGLTIVEGVALKSTLFNGLTLEQCTSRPFVAMCDVDTWLENEGVGPHLYQSYIKASVEAGNNASFTQDAVATRSFFKGVDFSSGGADLSFDLNTAALESCGPACGNLSEGSVFARISGTEFLTPTSHAILLDSPGIVSLDSCTIDGSASAPIRVTTAAQVSLSNIPAGVGNLSLGVLLAGGARCEATSTVALTASLGNVSIGSLGARTWAAVTAAPGNRINDLTASLITGVVTGDGSTAHRTP